MEIIKKIVVLDLPSVFDYILVKLCVIPVREWGKKINLFADRLDNLF